MSFLRTLKTQSEDLVHIPPVSEVNLDASLTQSICPPIFLEHSVMHRKIFSILEILLWIVMFFANIWNYFTSHAIFFSLCKHYKQLSFLSLKSILTVISFHRIKETIFFNNLLHFETLSTWHVLLADKF